MSKYDRQAKTKVYEDLKSLFDRQIRLLEMQSAILIGLVKDLGFDVAIDTFDDNLDDGFLDDDLDDDSYDDFLDDLSIDDSYDDLDDLNKALKDFAVDNSEKWDFSYDQKTAHSKTSK